MKVISWLPNLRFKLNFTTLFSHLLHLFVLVTSTPRLDQHSGVAGGRCSVLGAAMLQTILKFPPDFIPQFVESLCSRTPREALSAAGEAGGSRALEVFLGSPAHKPKLKKELIDSLATDWGRLAVSPAGSHVLEACYGSAEQRTRWGCTS
jgi:nucleolar protein 9